MDKNKIKEIIGDLVNRKNQDLFLAKEFLESEHEETKLLIQNLVLHLDVLEFYYSQIINELKNRRNENN